MAVKLKAPPKKAAAKKTAAKKSTAAKAHAKAEESCCAEGGECTGPALGTICHIDFEAGDVAKAQAFYRAMFGWNFYPFTPESVYFEIPGGHLGGCINQGTRTSQSTSFYVTVNDIPAALAKAEKLGGKSVTPRTEICGGHGFYGQLHDPAGNLVSVWARG